RPVEEHEVHDAFAGTARYRGAANVLHYNIGQVRLRAVDPWVDHSVVGRFFKPSGRIGNPPYIVVCHPSVNRSNQGGYPPGNLGGAWVMLAAGNWPVLFGLDQHILLS